MNKNEAKSLVELYVNEKKSVLNDFPSEEVALIAEEVWNAYQDGKTIYACGNGGNAAYVANFITDLTNHPFVSEDKSRVLPSDIKRIRGIDLTASSATITGLTNDISFDFIFSQQLINDGVSQGDLVFGFTGSGNSKNIVEAFHTAKKYGARSIAVTRGSGGQAKEIADHCVIIPGTSMFPGQMGKNDNNFHYEDALSSIAHIITGYVKRRLEQSNR